MKRLPALLAALALLSAPALADCRFGAPRARLRDGEIRFSTAVDSDLPVYLVTADVEVRNQPGIEGFTGTLFKPIRLETLQALFA